MTHATTLNIQRTLITNAPTSENDNNIGRLNSRRVFREKSDQAVLKELLLTCSFMPGGVGTGMLLFARPLTGITKYACIAWISINTLTTMCWFCIKDRYQNQPVYFPLSTDTSGRFYSLKELPPLQLPRVFQRDIPPAGVNKLQVEVVHGGKSRTYQEINTRRIYENRLKYLLTMFSGGCLSYAIYSENGGVAFGLLIISMMIVARTSVGETTERVILENPTAQEIKKLDSETTIEVVK